MRVAAPNVEIGGFWNGHFHLVGFWKGERPFSTVRQACMYLCAREERLLLWNCRTTNRLPLQSYFCLQRR
jgi:hypothetical protein